MTTKTFPLYDILSKELPPDIKELNDAKKSVLASSISTLDNKGQTLLYSIIQTYSQQNNDRRTIVPYGGSRRRNNFYFNLKKMPKELVYILKIFVDKHINADKDRPAKDEKKTK
jgi:hypothetical protein